MSSALGRVIRSAATRQAAPEWSQLGERIARERAEVERFLDGGGRAYGFSTRLGHLDAADADAEAMAGFLDDHRWGAPAALDVDVLRLIDAVKLEQLSHGGSGMSPDAAAAIVAHLEHRPPGDAHGAWLVSYGAGDVIPATWWLSDVLATTGFEPARGDFIAAVNGHFVSTAISAVALVESIGLLAEVVARVPGTTADDPAPTGATGAVLDSLVSVELADADAAQLPVSLRDSLPTVRAIAAAAEDGARAIAARLGTASANPKFEFDGDVAGGGARAVSNNGFLDYDVTLALARLATTVRLALDHVQRLVVHAADAAGDPRLVQAPKAVAAIAERAAMIRVPSPHGAAHSSGVEDLGDGSLLAASAVLATNARLREALGVAAVTGVPIRRRRSAVEAAMLGAIGVDAAHSGAVAGWADALRSIP